MKKAMMVILVVMFTASVSLAQSPDAGLLARAKKGDKDAQYELGNWYAQPLYQKYLGKGIVNDLSHLGDKLVWAATKRLTNWKEEAPRTAMVGAMVGVMIYDESALESPYKFGLALRAAGAMDGYEGGDYPVADLYRMAHALKWYRKAAEQGHAEAVVALARTHSGDPKFSLADALQASMWADHPAYLEYQKQQREQQRAAQLAKAEEAERKKQEEKLAKRQKAQGAAEAVSRIMKALGGN